MLLLLLLLLLPSRFYNHVKQETENDSFTGWDRPPTYTLSRPPNNLEELIKEGRLVAIWREENKTLTYISPRDIDGSPGRSWGRLQLEFRDMKLSLFIFGTTDNAELQKRPHSLWSWISRRKRASRFQPICMTGERSIFVLLELNVSRKYWG